MASGSHPVRWGCGMTLVSSRIFWAAGRAFAVDGCGQLDASPWRTTEFTALPTGPSNEVWREDGCVTPIRDGDESEYYRLLRAGAGD